MILKSVLTFTRLQHELIPKLIITSLNSEFLIIYRASAYENGSKNVINVKIRLVLG